MKLTRLIALASLLLPLSATAFAQETPEAAYAKWVEVSRAGDVDGLLALSTAAKVKEFHQEISTPEKREEIRNIMKATAPKSYQVKQKELSKDGNKASLFVDAVELDFFSMNDPKAKPEKQNVEVRLVKEGGQWKVDQQCNGADGCGKEPDFAKASYGKTIPLPANGSLKVSLSNGAAFKSVKLSGKPYSVDFTFRFPEQVDFAYFLHRSPKFSDFYLLTGEQKITPIAERQDFAPLASDKGDEKKAEVLKEDTSYSHSRSFTGDGTVSLLFDVPANVSGPKNLRFLFTVNGQKIAYEIP